jgi:hypothetical protein
VHILQRTHRDGEASVGFGLEGLYVGIAPSTSPNGMATETESDSGEPPPSAHPTKISPGWSCYADFAAFEVKCKCICIAPREPSETGPVTKAPSLQSSPHELRSRRCTHAPHTERLCGDFFPFFPMPQSSRVLPCTLTTVSASICRRRCGVLTDRRRAAGAAIWEVRAVANMVVCGVQEWSYGVSPADLESNLRDDRILAVRPYDSLTNRNEGFCLLGG